MRYWHGVLVDYYDDEDDDVCDAGGDGGGDAGGDAVHRHLSPRQVRVPANTT